MTSSRFEDLGISKDVLKAVRSVGWTEPTPVQTAAVPVGLKGVDLLAQAQTGTGKTGTFGSILLSRTKSGSSDPTSLILVPTRELASQVSEELEKLSEFSGHVCIPIYGGVNIENQAKQLKKGVDVVVATPGRLKDLIERKLVNLNNISIVVLDEADRMLDMGFAPSVNMILSRVPKERQTMMFSATMPEDVRKLAVKHMVDHQEVLVSKDELTLDLTEQYYIMTNRDSKRDELMRLIEDDYPKMMVFCRTKRKVDYLARKLKRDKYNVDGIHGDVGQSKRERIIKEFSQGDLQVLIASDVASRGLDIDGVDIVVNYDIPVDPETYVHRIGRTGRAGNSGKAITFVTADDIKGLNAIEKVVKKSIKEIHWSSLLYTEEPQVGSVPKDEDEPRQRKGDRKPASEKQGRASKRKAEPAEEEQPAKKERGSRRKSEPAEADEQPAKKERGSRRKSEPKTQKSESEEGEDDEPVRKDRTLRGKLDRKSRRESREEEPRETRKSKQEKQPKEDRQSKRGEKKTSEKNSEKSSERPARERREESEAPAGAQSNGQYIPLGVPKNPKPLHSYVGIVRAARPKKDTSFDRLELNIGSSDGIDVDKLRKFVLDLVEIDSKDLGNMHVSDSKSRIQVVRYRSQEVVDELFGQVVNGKRVLIYNLTDKH